MSPIRMMGISPDRCIDIPLGHDWCGTGTEAEEATGLLSFQCSNCDAQFCITYADSKFIASYQYTENSCPEMTPEQFAKATLLISKFPEM
jgi:hypothetical protein